MDHWAVLGLERSDAESLEQAFRRRPAAGIPTSMEMIPRRRALQEDQ